MAVGQSGYADFNPNVQAKIGARIVYENDSKLLHEAYIDTRDSIASMSGNNKEYWNSYDDLPVASTLVEGVTPDPTLISGSYKSATPVHKGLVVEATDLAKNLAASDILTIIRNLLMKSYKESMDADKRDSMNGGTTNVVYSGSAVSRGQVTSGVTDAMITSMLEDLELGDAQYRTNFVNPVVETGTVPVTPAYVAIVHTKLKPAIRALTGYSGVEVYQKSTNLLPGEFGAITDKNIRFVDSTKAKVFTGEGLASADVYTILLMAEDAFAQTKIDMNPGGSFLFNMIGFGQGEDVLMQRMRAGYKYNQATVVLKEANVCRGECTSTVSQS
jgi:N4-gp56 family major capsid protein